MDDEHDSTQLNHALETNDRCETKRAAQDSGMKLMATPKDLQTIERRTIAKVPAEKGCEC